MTRTLLRARPAVFALTWALLALACDQETQSESAGRCGPNPLPILDDGSETYPWSARRQEIYDRIHAYLGVRPNQIPAPDVTVEGDCTPLDQTSRCRIWFNVETDERIPAWLFRPPGSESVPGIVAMHQTICEGKDEVAGLVGNPNYAYGLELAQQGYAVIAFDDVAAGERIVDDGCYDTTAFYARHPDWSALDKAVWDASRAIDALCTFPVVDCARIGAVGHSQGGVYSWMLAADDPRVKVAVVNAGYTTFAGDPDPVRWSRDGPWVGTPLLRSAVAVERFPFDFNEWLSLAAPQNLLVIGYQADHVFANPCAFDWTSQKLDPLLTSLGYPASMVFQMASGDHSFPFESHAAMLEFLQQRL